VLTFIGNYKHDRLNLTPTVQFQGGAQYGRPLQVAGIDPSAKTAGATGTGCSPLAGAGSTTAGDPRYPGTQPGSPYNAATCPFGMPIPDPFVGHFDNYGQFTEPNKLAVNLSVAYDISKQTKVRVDFVNVLTSCWGGSTVPWRVGGKAGCDDAGTTYVSNFYNPGDVVQPSFAYPYAPNFGGVFQSTTAGQANPFQVFASINIKF